jgi:hypothetical protein
MSSQSTIQRGKHINTYDVAFCPDIERMNRARMSIDLDLQNLKNIQQARLIGEKKRNEWYAQLSPWS